MSMTLYGLDSSFSNTIMEKDDVPAETLPVRCLTALVATMPVPASPSGGHKGIPGCRLPDSSSKAAPSIVSVPACSPASRIDGSMSFRFHPNCSLQTRLSNFLIISALYSLVQESTGIIPDASPMPRTFLPVSLQCTYPASVVRKEMEFTWGSLSRIA